MTRPIELEDRYEIHFTVKFWTNVLVIAFFEEVGYELVLIVHSGISLQSVAKG